MFAALLLFSTLPDPASADPTALLEAIFNAVHNGNGWLAAGPALSLLTWALLKYDKSIPKVGPAIDAFLNQPLVAFLLPTVLSAATGLFSALAIHRPVGPALLTALKVSAMAAFTFLALKNGAEQKAPAVPPVAPVLLAIIALGLSSCAHSDPLLVTRDTIVGTGQAFEATAGVMQTLEESGQLTAAQKESWGLFKMRFKTSFHAARILYDDAVADGNASLQQAASNIIANFAVQLSTFEALAAELAHPDGGV